MREYPELTHFIAEDADTLIRIGVILTGDTGYDSIRKAQLKASEPKIRTWLSAVKHRIEVLKLKPIQFDAFFSLVDTGTLGRAVLEADYSYWFKISSSYLSGKKNLKSTEAVSVFMHEWGHIWLFNQSAIGNEKPIERLQRKLEVFREKYEKTADEKIRYALSDDHGDELFAYLVQHNDKLSKDFRSLFEAVISLGK